MLVLLLLMFVSRDAYRHAFSPCESLAELLLGVNVLDFQEIHERLSFIESEPLRARLAGELLEAMSRRNGLRKRCSQAAGRLMDCTSSEAMRAGISEFGRVLEEEEEECLAPALQCQKDLETWQWRWPSLCFSVRATGRRRLAIGLEVWAAALPDAAQLLEPLEVVDKAAEEARLQALQELNLEEIDQDELPEPEPHEPRGFKLLLKLLESCCLELFGAFYRCLSSPRGLKEAFRVMF